MRMIARAAAQAERARQQAEARQQAVTVRQLRDQRLNVVESAGGAAFG